MTPEQKAEIDQQRQQRAASGGEEFPWLNPSTVAGNADKFRDNELKNRRAYREAFDESSGLDQFVAGFGKPARQLVEGIGLGDVLGIDPDTAVMEEEMHGFPAAAGNVAGEIAMMAVPAGKTGQYISTATKGARPIVQAGSVLGGESLLAGAVEGAKAPETGETRFGNAGEAAGWTAALGLPFAGMSSLVPKVTDEAARLLDEGIALTPAMAGGEGSKRAAVETFMSNIPWLGGKVKEMQNTAIEDWNKYLLNRVSPTSDEITDIGHEGFKQVQNRFTKEYTDIWDSVTPNNFNLNKFDQKFEQARGALRALPADDQNTARTVLDRVESDVLSFADNGQVGLIENMDDVLRELASDASAKGNMLTNDFYNTIRASLREAVPEDTIKRLIKTDKHYRDFKTVEHGASYVKAQEAGAVINPRQLESAVKAKNAPSATTKGQGAMQSEAADATASIAVPLANRSEVSAAGDLGKWGTIIGVGATGGGAAIPLVGARMGLNESMRKFLTGARVEQLNLPAQLMRTLRQLGVSTIDEIQDPVMKSQVVQAVEAELAAGE